MGARKARPSQNEANRRQNISRLACEQTVVGKHFNKLSVTSLLTRKPEFLFAPQRILFGSEHFHLCRSISGYNALFPLCAFRVLQFNMQFGRTRNERTLTGADQPRSDDRRDRSHNADIVLLQRGEQALAGGVQPETSAELSCACAAAFPTTTHFLSYPKADPRDCQIGSGCILSKTALSDHDSFQSAVTPGGVSFQGESPRRPRTAS